MQFFFFILVSFQVGHKYLQSQMNGVVSRWFLNTPAKWKRLRVFFSLPSPFKHMLSSNFPNKHNNELRNGSRKRGKINGSKLVIQFLLVFLFSSNSFFPSLFSRLFFKLNGTELKWQEKIWRGWNQIITQPIFIVLSSAYEAFSDRLLCKSGRTLIIIADN